MSDQCDQKRGLIEGARAFEALASSCDSVTVHGVRDGAHVSEEFSGSEVRMVLPVSSPVSDDSLDLTDRIAKAMLERIWEEGNQDLTWDAAGDWTKDKYRIMANVAIAAVPATEALQNVMGHIDTPIARRRLKITDHVPEWLTSGRAAIALLKGHL